VCRRSGCKLKRCGSKGYRWPEMQADDLQNEWFRGPQPKCRGGK
jgi:hypothetical protein